MLVGFEYRGPEIDGVVIETRGLANQEFGQLYAAAALYEYDVIIIYPKSYSHFIFGYETSHSNSPSELNDLKRENNYYDIDTIFDYTERSTELLLALKQGAHVIWLMTPDKRMNFFGYRTLYKGYLSPIADRYIRSSTLYIKHSKKLKINTTPFETYFQQLQIDGWQLWWNSAPDENVKPLASTPEMYNLGVEIVEGQNRYWMLTPPTTESSFVELVKAACSLKEESVVLSKYHGIFLSHNSKDKPFVRKLKKSLNEKGVRKVWVDEAEILIGDSLINKIQEGINQTKYFGIVLSKNSIQSQWVQKELEQAMLMEITHRNVKVLPLLLEQCELPGFLQGKLCRFHNTRVI
ncbi:MAG TPA: toll/interleukin-1 receptor domain-containing protein [Bacillus sp. (in: firmicutes)]|nr:toll/interleukin-1 receptor domain-containing protein [Bacillus sp. (in: firmicutes)]